MKSVEEQKTQELPPLTEQDQAFIKLSIKDNVLSFRTRKLLEKADINIEAIIEHITAKNFSETSSDLSLEKLLKNLSGTDQYTYSSELEHQACDKSVEYMKKLLNIGVDVRSVFNERDGMNFSPRVFNTLLDHIPEGYTKVELIQNLYSKLSFFKVDTRPYIADILLNNGAEVNYQYPDFQNTLLHLATRDLTPYSYGDALLEVLISHGGRMDIPNKAGETPMQNFKSWLHWYQWPLFNALRPGKSDKFENLITDALEKTKTPLAGGGQDLDTKDIIKTINHVSMLKSVMLHAVIFNDLSPLKSLIKSGKLVVNLGYILNNNVGINILAQAIAQVSEELPLDHPIEIDIKYPFDYTAHIKACVAPILDAIYIHNGSIMSQAMDEVAITGHFESKSGNNTEANVHDILAQFHGDIKPNGREVDLRLQQLRKDALEVLTIIGSHNSNGYKTSEGPQNSNSVRKEINEEGITELLAEFYGRVPPVSARLFYPDTDPSLNANISLTDFISAATAAIVPQNVEELQALGLLE